MVNAAGLILIGVGVLVAAATWRLRSPAAAVASPAIATGAGCVMAMIAELISFSLGAA